jgi:methyl coenzyme M reductase subunit D
MEQIPLPSPIHYELILQLLERQTMSAVSQNTELRHQVNQLIITLRKAAAQQKRLEEICQTTSVAVDYRWSINHHNQVEKLVFPD